MTSIENEAACPCGSGQSYADCCAPWHQGALPPDAERLMRSRYSAYVLNLMEYLVSSTLPAQQAELDVEAMRAWSQSSQWLGLTVETHEPQPPDRAYVTFTARWRETDGTEHAHRERSSFVCRDSRWYFIDPTVTLKCGRNDVCPCGSGRKYKKCCVCG